MSRSFAILLKEVRERTPDPERPGKMLTQARAAELIGCSLQGYRFYEQDKRLPHPIIRTQIFRIWPALTTTE